MKTIFNRISHTLSMKLGLAIVFFTGIVFVMSFGYLFVRSRQYVKEEAIVRAMRVLDETSLRIMGIMSEIETATHNAEWFVMQDQTPDSLLQYSHRVVMLNSNVSGCSITMAPDFYPSSVGHFSAYSLRQGDSIATEREDDYDYYSEVWYKTAKETGKPCWVGPYDDTDEGSLSATDKITSYCLPLYSAQGKIIGVISTDISLRWLSETISEEKPYPNSFSIMLNHDGHYLVHPDTTHLFKETIFNNVENIEELDNKILVGHQMLEGKEDHKRVLRKGEPYYIFYKPIQQTGWSIGLICPEDDILGNYNRLGYIIFVVIGVGLLLLLFFCIRSVNHFIAPLNQLVSQSHDIAAGNFSERMPYSDRQDLVGQLQNSFVTMQQSLDEHIGRLQQTNEEAERRNRELINATKLAQEANNRKQEFIRDVSHQLRTPLNIIQGFFLVLRDGYNELPVEEKNDLMGTIRHNVVSLRRMVSMLVDASWLESGASIECHDSVGCNDVAREAVNAFNQRAPYSVELDFRTTVPDELHVRTDREHLFRILRELLFNAKKFGDGGTVRLLLESNADSVLFTVEDNGPGIPEAEREHIFSHFIKLDSFSEGLGLGLNLSHQFAHRMGGELKLDTDYTSGCRFILTIPMR